MVSLVSASEVFQSCEIPAAVQNPETDRIDLGHRDVEVAASLLYVTDDKARAIHTNPELGIYRP